MLPTKTTKSTITTIASAGLLITTILSSVGAKAADAGNYVSLTGEYIASAKADGDVSSGAVSVSVSIDYKNGLGGLLAFGSYFTPDIRGELELGYRELKASTASITLSGVTYTVDASTLKSNALSTMANLFYDIPTGSNLTPYLGIGAGWAHQTNNGGSDAFAYQGMVGVNYKLSESSTIFTGYRYLGTTDFEHKYFVSGIGTVTERENVSAHSVDVGYRFSF